jgi:hypothetical protein
MSETYKQVRAEKAPGDVADYVIDYTKDLQQIAPNDTIQSSTWTSTGNIVIDDATGFDTLRAWVWVSGGGRIGEISRLTNTVVTVGGRTFVRVIIIKMVTALAQIPEEVVEPIVV